MAAGHPLPLAGDPLPGPGWGGHGDLGGAPGLQEEEEEKEGGERWRGGR